MRKLTHEQFMERFYKKNKHAQNIEVLGTYVNTNTKILCKCKVCEHEWAPTAGSLLNGKGYPIYLRVFFNVNVLTLCVFPVQLPYKVR